MGYRFRGQGLDEQFLLPPSMLDWLPEDHLVFFIIEVVSQVDVSQALRRFRVDGRGGAPYDPRILLAVMCYCYATGTVSSRQIERRCVEDVACRVAAGNTRPDHVTICRFRTQDTLLFTSLFSTVLDLCVSAGLVDPGLIAVDGTKLKANASRDRSLTVRQLAQCLVDMADDVDMREQASQVLVDDSVVVNRLAKPGRDRIERIARALSELKAEQNHFDPKVNSSRQPRQRANTTDPDSRIMKTKDGFIQGYNAQAAVCVNQVVVAADVFTDRTDYNLLEPMVEQTLNNLGHPGGCDGVGSCFVADAPIFD